ncbi:L-serine ammonia-lyase [Erwinia oleae]|uniref:L-serine ammonia-lyase n=1 Tax=Erwinia oleae TaxID=796334 RepID=UPI000551A92C|nr:L-serine ammonia-lyase [Erwinia oleae]
MISVFDIFKVSIGPSSSHTVGPMKAGKHFTDCLREKGLLDNVTRLVVDVYGSLSLTGKGHHTDIAIILGLSGYLPDTVDVDAISVMIKDVNDKNRLIIDEGRREIAFPVTECMRFHNEFLPLHENGMSITAFSDGRMMHSQTYYSTGGGFIVTEEEFGKNQEAECAIPFPFYSARNLLAHCHDNCLSISAVMMKNEVARHGRSDVEQQMAAIWETMKNAIHRGMKTEGTLPGPLKVPRRASALHRVLEPQGQHVTPLSAMDWVNMFAMAVSEENASGGRVVTAPTNGACGIIPAVIAYYDRFVQPVTPEIYTRYYLTAGAIGILYKMNASISGAEVGCQGEVGVACSMASAGLAELLGGSPEKVCIAAEIGMEHNLGLTCDPVAGQVQVPCIERNAIAAVKAINAASMAMYRTSDPKVSLDKVIETMFETGKDMNAKYRETARGGLAIKVAVCEA